MSTRDLLEGVLVDAAGSDAAQPLWVDVKLFQGAKLLHHERRCPEVALRLDDGTLVRAGASDARLVPVRLRTGSFGELFEDPLAEYVLEHAPGDHVVVTLEGAVLEGGQRAALYGEVSVERRADGGYRDSREVPSRIEVLAAGAGARAQVEAEAKRIDAAALAESLSVQAAEASAKAGPARVAAAAPSLLPALLVLALSGAIGAIGWFGLVSPGRPFVVAGLAFASAAIFVFRRRRWVPDLRPLATGSRNASYRWHSRRWLAMWVFFGAVVLWVASISPVDSVNELDRFFGQSSPFLLALIPVVALMALLFSDQPSANRALRMLLAKRLGKDATSGSFGAMEGRLRHPIERVTQYTRSASTDQETYTNDRGQHVTRNRTTYRVTAASSATEGSVEVDTGDGVVEVHVGGAIFGADEPLVRQRSGGMRALVGTLAGRFARLEERAEPGDLVLVVGRVLEREGARTVRPGGAESLFLFAAKGSPRAALGRHLALHYASLLAIAGCAAATYWAAATLD